MAEARAVMLAGLSKKKASIHKNHVAEAAVLGSVLFAATGHLLIKSGLNALANANAQAGFAPRLFGYVQHSAVMCGLAIYAIGTALWVFAVSKREISYLFPLSALNYVVVALGGVWLLGEKIPNTRWLGILIVFAGVWLMQRWGAEESR